MAFRSNSALSLRDSLFLPIIMRCTSTKMVIKVYYLRIYCVTLAKTSEPSSSFFPTSSPFSSFFCSVEIYFLENGKYKGTIIISINRPFRFSIKSREKTYFFVCAMARADGGWKMKMENRLKHELNFPENVLLWNFWFVEWTCLGWRNLAKNFFPWWLFFRPMLMRYGNVGWMGRW